MIHIVLHSVYRKQTPDGLQSKLDLEMEEGTTLDRVIEYLGLADQFDNMLVVNGQ